MGSTAALTVLLSASGAAAQTTLTGGDVSNQTWTMVGSPYIILGDITVPAGAFLHIEAGVDVQIGANDQQSSLPDTERVAISILGEIEVNGTQDDPVHIHAQNGTSINTWHGLVIGNVATRARFSHVLLEHAVEGLASSSSLIEITASQFENNNFWGVRLNAGATKFDRILFKDNERAGAYVAGGTVTMTNIIAIDNRDFGFQVEAGDATIVNSVAHSNNIYGFNCGGGTMSIINSLATSNGIYGVRHDNSGTVTVTTTNFFGNITSATDGIMTIVDGFTDDPEYVDGASGNLELQSSSPCIDRGITTSAPNNDFKNVLRPIDGDSQNAAEYDVGPYEYSPTSFCGDTVLDGGETCDDGASNGSYGFCKADCSGAGPYCGDGNTDAGNETCDDGNTDPGDGCDQNCQSESMGTGGSGGMGTGGMSTGGSSTGGSSSGPGGSSSGPGGSMMACLPGEQVACACTDGAQGAQTCNEQGTGFGGCTCAKDNGTVDAEGGCTVDGSPAKPAGAAALLMLLGAAGLMRRRRTR